MWSRDTFQVKQQRYFGYLVKEDATCNQVLSIHEWLSSLTTHFLFYYGRDDPALNIACTDLR